MKFLLSLLLLVTSNSVWADTAVSPWLGAGIGYFQGDQRGNGSARLALAAGVQIEKALSPAFRLALEPRYNPQGVNVGPVFGLTGDVATDYLEFAALAAWNVLGSSNRVSGKWQFQITAGPFFGIAVNREIELLSLAKVDLKTQLTGTNLGMELGAQSDYWIMTGLAVRLSVRFLLGLQNISQVASEEFQTRQLLISLGLNWVI